MDDLHQARIDKWADHIDAGAHASLPELRDGHWLRFLIVVGMVNDSWPCSPTRPPRQGRGHALTIESGCREVADTALAFGQRFT
jgi:hypothetical protein